MPSAPANLISANKFPICGPGGIPREIISCGAILGFIKRRLSMKLDKFCQSCMLPKENEFFEKATEKDRTNF